MRETWRKVCGRTELKKLDLGILRESLISNPSEISLDRIQAEFSKNSVISDWDSVQSVVNRLKTDLEGLGPLAVLIQPGVTDILVNSPSEIWTDGIQGMVLTKTRFESIADLTSFVSRLLISAGARLDLSVPRADAVLPGGIRVSAVLPPISGTGPILALRIPRVQNLNLSMWGNSDISLQMLQSMLNQKLNLVISGQTGSGKTTLLKSFLNELPMDARVITIEDQPELTGQARHQISLLSRSPNLEGIGEVTLSELLRQSLRMRPDRIVIGELRGAEVLVWLQAINTGHDGSLTTIHANSGKDAMSRLKLLTLLSGVSAEVGQQLIHQMVDLVLHCSRNESGRHISEIQPVSERGYLWKSQIMSR